MRKAFTIALLGCALITGAALADYNNPHGNSSNSPHLRDSQGKFLGNLNNNPMDPNSVANPMGRYGSPMSPDSINNPMGRYGSSMNPESPHNPHGRSLSIHGPR